MAKKVDITEKLSFEESPIITIKGKDYKVNDDAETVLRLMSLIGDGSDVTAKNLTEIYNLLFEEKERKRIMNLKLNFRDFQTIAQEAMNLIIGADGEEERQGE